MSPLPQTRRPHPRPLREMLRRPVLGLACACLALPGMLLSGGCGTVAVNNPEFMSPEDFQRGAEIITYEHEPAFVWLRAKETLVHLSSRQPDFNDDTMRAFATVEEGSIQIGIIPLGDGEGCRMAVRAREFGVFSSELAARVLNRIHEEIEPQ